MAKQKRYITKALLDEISLIFRKYDGREFLPVNPEATVLAVKGKEVESKSLFDKIKDAIKGYLVADDTKDDVDNDGDGGRDYEDLFGHLSRTYGDLQQAAMIGHEGARSDAIKRILDDHMDWIDAKRAGGDNDNESQGEPYGNKAGARHNADDLARLKALQEAHDKASKQHDKIGKSLEEMREHLDGLGIHQTNENNDGAQNKDKQKKDQHADSKEGDDQNAGDRPRSGEGKKSLEEFVPGAVAEDGYPQNYAELDKIEVEGDDAVKARDDKKKKPYGDVEYADPEEGKYPIDTEEHVRAALSYVNQEKNKSALGDKYESTRKRIYAAAKKFGIKTEEDGGEKSLEITLKAEDIKAAVDQAVAETIEPMKAENEALKAKLADAEKAKADAESRADEVAKKATEEKSKLERAAELAKKSRTSGVVDNVTQEGERKDPQDGAIRPATGARKAITEGANGAKLDDLQARVAEILAEGKPA